MGVFLKLENMMEEVVKSSWLVTLYFMKSKYKYSQLLYWIAHLSCFILVSIFKSVAVRCLSYDSEGSFIMLEGMA